MERRLRKVEGKHSAALLEMLRVAQLELKRLDFIIDQFLAAIRPTHPQLQKVQLNELVRESVDFLKPELKQSGVKVEFDLVSTLPPMPLDANQMKQAFYNLIRNACQAMPDGGTLAIASVCNDFEVRLTFTDTGKGISPGNMSNMFQPFFTTRQTGTGLGLLIVRRIVREHGGEIELESTEGQGTKVTIFLPLVEKKLRMLAAGDAQEVDSAAPKPQDGA
jgi:signal transduction histidine kinase